ncbi:hypothetical protein [Undibacterium curvum]|uniref:hypothetical protein n=1 Tax=Undibacterium curvum TaxID=2762294 RepID=UPI003D144B11
MNIHGQWQLDLIGDVLVRTFAGSFNQQGTEALFAEVKMKIPKDKPWAALAHGAMWEMSTQDALHSYSSMSEWAFANGCVCIAFILPSKLHLDILRREAGVAQDPRYQSCASLEQACAWLTQRGFPISPELYPHRAFLNRLEQQLHHSA